jgi:hypothetical protein
VAGWASGPECFDTDLTAEVAPAAGTAFTLGAETGAALGAATDAPFAFAAVVFGLCLLTLPAGEAGAKAEESFFTQSWVPAQFATAALIARDNGCEWPRLPVLVDIPS